MGMGTYMYVDLHVPQNGGLDDKIWTKTQQIEAS